MTNESGSSRYWTKTLTCPPPQAFTGERGNLSKLNIAKAIEQAVAGRSEKLPVSAEDTVQSILAVRDRGMAEKKLLNGLEAN